MPIEMLRGPASSQTAGMFSLPTCFKTEKFAAQWSKVGPDADKAMEKQHIIGTNLTADGWQIYRDKDKKPVKRASQNGDYVLMFRPKEIQNAVNAIYGNVGYERMVQEKKGETVGGVPVSDFGMLNEAAIVKATGENLSEQDRGVVMNPVPKELIASHVEVAPLETAAD